MASNVLGDFLRDLRHKKRLSLRDVGEKVYVSASYLSQIETGERQPSAEILRKLAPAYGVPVRDILEIAGILDEPEHKLTDAEH
ncbi:MAG: helix-turn-helix transcriptional regulator, partial [Chloroflexi bacterium]|nr:helix-turn-helix transcriptional regulator [Chloroflexota bacterium]